MSLTGDTFGTIGPILAGQGVESSPFQRLVLTDNTGAVNRGTILVADNKFVDDRITGSVEVVDGGKNRTISNQTFMGFCHGAPVAGSYSHMQLFNPIDSGKNVIVKSIFISSPTNGYFSLQRLNTQLTTLLTTGGAPKKIGGSVGKTEQRFQTDATVLGTAMQLLTYIAAYIPFQMKFEEPMVIPPGQSLMTVTGTTNQELPTMFEYYEEAIL